MATESYETPKEGVSMDREYSKGKNAKVPGSGLYRHPESGEEAIVQSDPLWGNTQAQAFARLGFKFVREATEGEIKTLPEIAMDARREEEGNLKGLSARLDKLEGVAEDNKALTDEVAELRAKLEAEQKAREEAEKREADAREQIKVAGEKTTNTTTAADKSAEGAKENAEKVTEGRESATGKTNTQVTNKEGK